MFLLQKRTKRAVYVAYNYTSYISSTNGIIKSFIYKQVGEFKVRSVTNGVA